MEKNLKNIPELKQFIIENSSLFWWMKSEDKPNISLNALVEAVLNYGNEKNVKQLFNLVGIKNVADIFNRQTTGDRSNYHKRTTNFFKLYFKKHAS